MKWLSEAQPLHPDKITPPPDSGVGCKVLSLPWLLGMGEHVGRCQCGQIPFSGLGSYVQPQDKDIVVTVIPAGPLMTAGMTDSKSLLAVLEDSKFHATLSATMTTVLLKAGHSMWVPLGTFYMLSGYKERTVAICQVICSKNLLKQCDDTVWGMIRQGHDEYLHQNCTTKPWDSVAKAWDEWCGTLADGTLGVAAAAAVGEGTVGSATVCEGTVGEALTA